MATPFPFTSGQTLTAAQMNAVTTLPVSTKTASYTCVVGDVGSRIVMNVASANTVTINNSIFAEGDTIFIANKGAGATTITAGAGVTINTTGSLALAQHGGGTLVALSASVFAFFSGSAGVSYGVATGGTSSSISVGSPAVSYTLLSFLSDGSLVVTTAGLFDVLLLGGGGASGSARSNYGTSGGGGAGGLLQQTIYLETGTYTVDVGAGGAGGATNHVAAQGLPSSIIGLSAPFAIFAGGGGAGASPFSNFGRASTAGGSSGGAANNQSDSPAATVSGCGNNGGQGGSSGSYAGGGGGGGGAGSAGANGSGSTGGNGGNGTDIATFLGSATAVTVGGGGGGGGTTLGSDGTGTGSNNSGGGNQGKSAASNLDGSAGFSGRVAVRFKV